MTPGTRMEVTMHTILTQFLIKLLQGVLKKWDLLLLFQVVNPTFFGTPCSNFDKIVALACTPIRPSRLYFEHHEGLSSEARDSFDWLKDRLILYRYDNPGEALVVIASLYQIGKHSSY